MDGAFLALESSTGHLHIVGVLVLDPGTLLADGSATAFRHIRTHLADRVPLVPPFRMKLHPAPFGLAHPELVDDPEFDLDYHLRRAALPRPGGRRELERLVAAISSRPLDRRRPLWEMHVVEGLAGGEVAVVAKVHHAISDGVGGTELLATFLDAEPRAAVAPLAPLDRHRALASPPGPTSLPSPAGRPPARPAIEPWLGLLGTVPEQLDAVVRSIGRTARRLGAAAGRRRPSSTVRPPLPLTAPKTSINGAISPHRRVALTDLSMGDVRRVREVLGGTVNDVLLAAVAGSLRRFLAARSEDPEAGLVALVPVSVRDESERGSLGNRVSGMLVTLPTVLDDPVARLRAVRDSVSAGKQAEADDADLWWGWAQAVVPALAAPLSQLATDKQLFDRLPPLFNLVISNIPGPPFPLYLGGLPLRSVHPLGPVVEGSALNVTAASYVDRLHVGVHACWGLVPEVEAIAGGIEDSLAELVRAADRRDRPVPWWHAEVPA